MARPKSPILAKYVCPICGHVERQLPEIEVWHGCRGEDGLNPPKTRVLKQKEVERGQRRKLA